ncbi:MAG: hypothetical protein QOF76_2755 [Solirubrobacteraceae bacterium]|nr:hypothetical protein [Solirubrobacteraceae bacterium]
MPVEHVVTSPVTRSTRLLARVSEWESDHAAAVALLATGALILAPLSILSSAMNQMLSLALYRQTTADSTAGPWTGAALNGSVRVKRSRRGSAA